MGQISDIHYSEILVATVKLLIKKSTKIKGNEWIYVVYTQWLCKSNLLQIHGDKKGHKLTHVDFIEL